MNGNMIQEMANYLNSTPIITRFDVIAIICINITLIFVIKLIFMIINKFEYKTYYRKRLSLSLDYMLNDKMTSYEKAYVKKTFSSLFNIKVMISFVERLIYIIGFITFNVNLVVVVLLFKTFMQFLYDYPAHNKNKIVSDTILETMLNILFAIIVTYFTLV